MMRILFTIFLSFLFLLPTWAQEDTTPEEEPTVLEIDLTQFCVEQEEIEEISNDNAIHPENCGTQPQTIPEQVVDLSQQVELALDPLMGFTLPLQYSGTQRVTCEMINRLAAQNPAPVEISMQDTDGSPWLIRFHMGFTRTLYAPTDMTINSSRLQVEIKGYQFSERTSGHHWNPSTWKTWENYLQWIDEPTNTFTISIEHKNDVFYLTAFHPKFLQKKGQVAHVTGTVDGVEVDKEMPLYEEFDGYNNQPGEMYLHGMENTYMQMDWQVGYGHKFVILGKKNDRFGQLTYTPRADVGLTTGQSRTAYTKIGEYWEYDSFEDKNRIQGANASLGHRLEYKYGKVSMFVDQKITFSHLEHKFLDGTAEYNMRYMPVSFGLGIDLYKVKAKKKPGL